MPTSTMSSFPAPSVAVTCTGRLAVLAGLLIGLLGLGACSSPGPSDPGCADASCPPDPSAKCGDGVVSRGEACDGALLGGASCASLGFSGGTLRCAADCSKLEDGDCYRACDTTTLAVRTAPVKVTLTLDGGAWPAKGISGNDYTPSVVFVRTDNQQEFPVVIGAGGAATARLIQGTYDVYVDANRSDVGNVVYSQRARLAQGVAVQAAVERTFDVATATLTATVTLNGGAWPAKGISGNDYAPSLILRRADGKYDFQVPIGAGGAVSAKLIKGTYDVLIDANRSDVGNTVYSQVAGLAQGLAVQGPTTKTFDVATATLTATVTLNGGAWPAKGISGNDYEPSLVLRRADGKYDFHVLIGAGGAVSAKLIKGTYDVLIDANRSDVGNTAYSQMAGLAQGVAVQGPTSKSFDVATTTLTATVTLNGGAWPAKGISGNDYEPSLVLRRADSKYDFQVLIGAGGAVSAKLIKGTYDVLIDANRSDVGNVVYSQVAALAQGVAVQGPTTRSFDVATATLAATVTLNGGAWPARGISGNDYAPSLVLHRGDSKYDFHVLIGAGGAVSAKLIQGTYDVLVDANRSDVSNVVYSQVAGLAQAVALQGPTTKSFDVATTTLPTTVTLDGGPWPLKGISGNDYTPSLVFVRGDSKQPFNVLIGAGGAVSAKLIQGTYGIGIDANRSDVGNVVYSQRVQLLGNCREPSN